MIQGLPIGVRYAFQMKSETPRDLIDEFSRIAEVVRQSGPIALENVQTENNFLAQGACDTSPTATTRDSSGRPWRRTANKFLQRVGCGVRKSIESMGDAAPAWGMIGHDSR